MTFTDWPGVGDVPEPEADGFRAEQVEAENERRQAERDAMADRAKERADFYAGRSSNDAETPDEPVVES